MPPSSAVAGAAPVWVGDRVTGPVHAAPVLHTGAVAIYVRSGEDVIGLLARHATPTPCSIVTRVDDVADLFGGRPPAVGDEVQVGGGRLEWDGHRVRIVRYLDFSMPRIDRAAIAGMRAGLAAIEPDGPATDELTPHALYALRHVPADALEEVLGRGSGLTPFGDDVVCGVLATLLAAGDPCAPPLRARSRELAPRRTTALSATLLRRAGEGDVLTAFADVVRALTERSPDASTDASPDAAAAIAHLRAIGHTSGVGMLLGLRLALDHIHTRSCCP